MQIKKVELKYATKDGFISNSCEKSKHIKVLPWLSLVQSIEGSYDIGLGSSPTRQTGDKGFFIAPSGVQQTIVHHVNKQSSRMQSRWVFFDVIVNDTYRLDMLYDFPTIVPRDKAVELTVLFDALFSSDDIFENYSYYFKILKVLFSMATLRDEAMNIFMQRVLEYIEKNFSKDISVSQLADMLHMSESNFYSVFKRQFGTSPISYINNYRLSLAAEYLRQSEDSISEICERVGIQDPLYFSKIFRKTYGVSPRAYRNNQGDMTLTKGKI